MALRQKKTIRLARNSSEKQNRNSLQTNNGKNQHFFGYITAKTKWTVMIILEILLKKKQDFQEKNEFRFCRFELSKRNQYKPIQIWFRARPKNQTGARYGQRGGKVGSKGE